jgi:hypothetical protein
MAHAQGIRPAAWVRVEVVGSAEQPGIEVSTASRIGLDTPIQHADPGMNDVFPSAQGAHPILPHAPTETHNARADTR